VRRGAARAGARLTLQAAPAERQGRASSPQELSSGRLHARQKKDKVEKETKRRSVSRGSICRRLSFVCGRARRRSRPTPTRPLRRKQPATRPSPLAQAAGHLAASPLPVSPREPAAGTVRGNGSEEGGETMILTQCFAAARPQPGRRPRHRRCHFLLLVDPPRLLLGGLGARQRQQQPRHVAGRLCQVREGEVRPRALAARHRPSSDRRR
jgi:hypothetical protein